MVRKRGLEPPRSCERQPLKLVRLPIPPLPQRGVRPGQIRLDAIRRYGVLFAGVGAGAAGCGGAGAGGAAPGAAAGAARPPTTDPDPRCPQTDNVSDRRMNTAAIPAVALVRTVAPARAPKA